MKRQFLRTGIAFLAATLFIICDAHAQYRRYPGRYYPGGYYGGPRVSVGIGGVFGYGRWGGYYGGPNIGISVMLSPVVIGSRVRSLPPDARRVYYGNQVYYYSDNTYFLESDRGGYEVVAPPLGAGIERLPFGARKREINGNIYFEFNGIYYMAERDYRRNNRYIVVGTHGRLDTEEAMRQRDNSYMEEEDYDYNRRNRPPSDDEVYSRGNPPSENDIIVKNGNDTPSTGSNQNQYTGPQIGDRFESLPRKTKPITINGQILYESQTGTRYREIKENGRTIYEVVQTK